MGAPFRCCFLPAIMDKIFVSQLVPNQTISTTFLVKSKELRNKKTGGQFAMLQLADRTGELMGQWWDNFEDSIDTFDRDDIVFVRGLVNTYRNHLQVTIHRVRPCQPHEITLSDYFPTTRFDVDQMFAELLGFIGEFRNPHLRLLLETIFADEETVRKFKRAPAAKTMHHPYLGGLLEHSLSLVKLCRLVAAHYSKVDVDLLVAGAILHDFGKIDELSYERGFGYTNDGQMIGHLVMETILVSDKIGQLPGFPADLRRHLLHMLLAHHGKLEYGSPKLPLTPEALLLAMLDDLDSKVEAMQRLIDDPHATGDWTRITPMFDRPLYRRRPMEDLPSTAEDPTHQAEGRESAPDRSAAPARVGGFHQPFAGLEELIKQAAE
jgi:3'-5' exoribonuclease